MNSDSRLSSGDDPALDRISHLHREQLSALVDGELSPDQARFLIRRLEHDEDLAACQERWQLMGDVLRGQLDVVAPLDFAAGVSAAVADEPVVAARPVQGARRGWLGGAGLAAALTVVGLVPWLQMPGSVSGTPAPVLVQTPAAPAPAMADRGAEVLPAVGQATPPPAVATLPVTAVARVERAVPARSRPGAVERAPRKTEAAEPLPAIAAVAAPASAAASPFSLPEVDVEARPWPRSSGTADGRFNVRLPSAGGRADPFAPEVAAQRLQQADHDRR